jgi:hypothetical protein
MRRIGGDDLTGDSVRIAARCCLTVGFSNSLPSPRIGRDMHRLDIDHLFDVLAPIAPGEEAPAPMKICGARIRVVDRDGEEFEKAARGFVAGGRDEDQYPAVARWSTRAAVPPRGNTASSSRAQPNSPFAETAARGPIPRRLEERGLRIPCRGRKTMEPHGKQNRLVSRSLLTAAKP